MKHSYHNFMSLKSTMHVYKLARGESWKVSK